MSFRSPVVPSLPTSCRLVGDQPGTRLVLFPSCQAICGVVKGPSMTKQPPATERWHGEAAQRSHSFGLRLRSSESRVTEPSRTSGKRKGNFLNVHYRQRGFLVGLGRPGMVEEMPNEARGGREGGGPRPRRAEGPAPQRRLACDHHRATLLRTCCCHRLL